MTMPNFLIIGDLKAGSTSLYSYLRQHPDVYMPARLKELRYFAYDEQNSYHLRAGSFPVRSCAEYERYFIGCGSAKAVGEASPNYMRSPVAAARIRERLPRVKLIASLRNPADRLRSVYEMQYRLGATRKAFDEQLFGQDAAWIKGNFYWPELSRFFRLFDREQIKVVLFDDLKSNAAGVVKDLYEFLGVDGSFVPDLTPQNTGGMPKNALLYLVLSRNRRLLRKLGPPPEPLRKVWSDIRKRSLRATEIDPCIRRKIIEVCRDDIQRTQDLIRRDLSNWMM